MKKILFILLMFVLLYNPNPTNPSDDDPSIDRHMENVTQLTFEGDNGEAYFSKMIPSSSSSQTAEGNRVIRSGL